MQCRVRLETRRVEALADPRPLWHLCAPSAYVQRDGQAEFRLLCMPLRYLFTFRSNTVYLSLGSISSSVGISIFQRSTFFMLWPMRRSAVSRVLTTVSTCRRRSRCRYF